MENYQGDHRLLHLQINKVVKWGNLTKITITHSIIKQVHALANLDNIPQVLKTKNLANSVIFDSAWISGVYYEEEEFDNNEY